MVIDLTLMFSMGPQCQTDNGLPCRSRRPFEAVDAPTVWVEYAPDLRAIEANRPKIRFHTLREHAGLVSREQLEG